MSKGVAVDSDQPTANGHFAAQFKPNSPEPGSGAAPSGKPDQPLPSAFDLFKPSWEAVTLNFASFVALYVLMALGVVVLIALLVLANLGSGHHANLPALVALILGAIVLLAYAVVAWPAVTFIKLKSSQGQQTTYKEALKAGRHFCLRYFLLSLLVACVVLVGLLLLIVPGVFMIRRYYLAQYVLIDQDIGVRESMRRSDQLSKGRPMAVWGVIGVQVLLQVPSFIPFVGSLISFAGYIAYYCAGAVRYQQLKALMGSGSNPAVKT